jgi:hypothetical protein
VDNAEERGGRMNPSEENEGMRRRGEEEGAIDRKKKETRKGGRRG